MALWLNVCLQVTKKSGSFRAHPCSRDQEFGEVIGDFRGIGKGFRARLNPANSSCLNSVTGAGIPKKRMRQFGKVDIPREAFIEALKMGD
jgi:hypothetical protein